MDDGGRYSEGAIFRESVPLPEMVPNSAATALPIRGRRVLAQGAASLLPAHRQVAVRALQIPGEQPRLLISQACHLVINDRGPTLWRRLRAAQCLDAFGA